VELAPLVARQVADFRHYAAAKGVAIRYEIRAPNAAVRFDPYCMDNALTNLIGNAVKFTDGGGEVCIDVTRDSQGHLCLHVQDSGVGIDAAFLRRLSEPFARDTSALVRQREGAGLGLALTKNYLELNGAWLSVESQRGKGSTFTIHFTTEIPTPTNRLFASQAPPRNIDGAPA